LEYIKKCLLAAKARGETITVMVIYNTYTTTNGHYYLDHGEGTFDIKDGYVTMKPQDNADFYSHKIFKGAHSQATSFTTEGLYFNV